MADFATVQNLIAVAETSAAAAKSALQSAERNTDGTLKNTAVTNLLTDYRAAKTAR